MKKNVVIICLCLILVSSFVSYLTFTGNTIIDDLFGRTEYISCEDSDEGLSPEQFGEVEANYVEGGEEKFRVFEDKCYTGRFNFFRGDLREFYCREDNKFAFKYVKCEGQCFEGECVSVISLLEGEEETFNFEGKEYTLSIDYRGDERIELNVNGEISDYLYEGDYFEIYGIKLYLSKVEIINNPDELETAFVEIIIPNAKEFEKETACDGKIKEFDDIRGEGGIPGNIYDISECDLSSISIQFLETLTFDQETIWPSADKLPKGFDPEELIIKGMNPGLGIRKLHEQGITGKGVNIAIIDQYVQGYHLEYEGKIIENYNEEWWYAAKDSMHGPAVTSLFVGKNIGVAPDAKVYFIAASTNININPEETNAYHYVKALDWIIEKNEELSALEKIRVVSVSASPSSFTDGDLWDKTVIRAKEKGILVITASMDFVGECWFNSVDNIDDITKCNPGFYNNIIVDPESVLVPMSPRTTAQEFEGGNKQGYIYWGAGKGSTSWCMPYGAGVMALGWQVNSELTPEQMKELLFESAYVNKDGANIINPKEFIELVKLTLDN